jgi:hypothetical protein
VFEPFGLRISCRGLTEREAEEAADRWGCEVDKDRSALAQTELTVGFLPGKLGSEVPDRTAASEAIPFEKNFGG